MSFKSIVIVTFACFLAGCTSLLLPSFDGGIANPDIRFLRAGEVMEGVKCALTAFMKDREHRLKWLREQDPRPFEQIETRQGTANTIFLVNAIHAEKGKGIRACHIGEHWEPTAKTPTKCVSNDCPGSMGEELGVSLWDYQLVRENSGDTKAKGCVPIPDYSRFALDPTQSAGVDLQLNAANTGSVNYTKLDAKHIDPRRDFFAPGGGANGAPYPLLSASYKGNTIFDLSAVIPQSIHAYIAKPAPIDYVPRGLRGLPGLSLLATNAEQNLLSLQAVCDAECLASQRLQTLTAAQPYLNAPAPKAAELSKEYNDLQAFPAVTDADAPEMKSKRDELSAQIERIKAIIRKLSAQDEQTKVSINNAINSLSAALLMIGPKSSREQILAAEKKVSETRDTVVNLALTFNKRQEADTITKKYLPEFDKREAALRDLDMHLGIVASSSLSPQAKATASKVPLENDFSTRCNFDKSTIRLDSDTEIDYLGLKDMLNNVVYEQASSRNIYIGVPEIAMDTLTLTTSFDIVLDASTGLSHLFHFFPLIVPPTGELKADHLHQLKVTLHGVKKKGDPANAKKLSQSCKDRVGDNTDDTFCDTEAGKLLESLIESVQQQSASTGQ